MVKCKVCRGSVKNNRCASCGVRQDVSKRGAENVAEARVVVNLRPEAPEHGFRRFGAAFGDEEIERVCQETASQVPVGHPAERVANAVADIVDFVKTPGGKAAIQGFKRTLKTFFAE